MRVTRSTLVLALAALALAACVPPAWERPAPPPVVVQPSPVEPTPPAPGLPAPPVERTRPSRGNPPFYEVFGVRYHVMPSSEGYKSRGKASWYGRQFHGKPTSSGVIYDMHSFTAAHKTLPLPTLVRVTNLANGRAVLVTVNDRGPFVADRIIDLSYAAATELDMVKSGLADVEVEAVTLDGNSPLLARGGGPVSDAPQPPQAIPPGPTVLPPENLYMQVGAFGEHANAARLQAQLEAGGVSRVVIRYDGASGPGLYRVRIGPLAGAEEFDSLAARVRALRITDNPTVVTEPAADGVRD